MSVIREYFFLPSDLLILSYRGIKKASVKDIRGIFILINSGIFMSLYTSFSILAIISVLLVILFFYWELDQKIIGSFINIKTNESHLQNIVSALILLDTFLILFFIFSLNFQLILFALLSIAFFLWNLNAKLSITIALITLGSIAIIQLLPEFMFPFNKQALAEQLSVWFYLFLFISVIKQGKELVHKSPPIIDLTPSNIS